MKTNLWIDTDPGIDDAFACAVACAHRDKLNLLGISTVAGNQTIDKVTGNALYLTHLCNSDGVPVVGGSPRPLVRVPHPTTDIHGPYGLGYLVPDACGKKVAAKNGIVYMYQTISSLPEGQKATIAAIGPLTNIALLLKTFPEVKDKIEQIVLMGGAAYGGNVTPTAEFNIWADPEAAEIVFQAELPIVMCGLDVTMKCVLTREHLAQLASGGSFQKKYAEMLRFYFDSPAYRDLNTTALHDVVTILYILDPDLFCGEKHVVHVSCTEDTCRGTTMVYDVGYSYQKKERQNVLLLNQVDLPKFQKAVMDALFSY